MLLLLNPFEIASPDENPTDTKPTDLAFFVPKTSPTFLVEQILTSLILNFFIIPQIMLLQVGNIFGHPVAY